MQSKIDLTWAQTSLARIQEAFEQEILEAPEAEIIEAARALGMRLDMKGSAAFMDLQHAFSLRSATITSRHSWSNALDQGMAEHRAEPDGASPVSREMRRRWRARDWDRE